MKDKFKKKQTRKSIFSYEYNWVLKYENFLPPIAIFFLSWFYFYFFGNYVFFYQENLLLFIFSTDFISRFISIPGGMLDYAGKFLTQFYFNDLMGSIILSSLFLIIAAVINKINKKLNLNNSLNILLSVLVPCILILTQTNINFLVHNTLGFLSVLTCFWFYISSEKRFVRYLIFFLFPVSYWLTGAYALILGGMFAVHSILNRKLIDVLIISIIAGLSLFVSKELLFITTWNELIYYPLPLKGYFNSPAILFSLLSLFVLYPGVTFVLKLIKIKPDSPGRFSLAALVFPLVITIVLVSKIHRKDVSDLFKLERMFFSGDWMSVINQHEKEQSNNLTAQYYYNTALAESGLLCERLFYGSQDFGSNSISIPWNSQIPMIQMFRGVYFYYSIGLINEAHRWAFESMVSQGYRPENIKLLIKTELINGHYKTAEKYIYLLKRTIHYRKLAKKYESMLNNPELIRSDAELGEKINLKPKDNFIVRIRDPYINISSLLEANPDNKRAFEYKMAWLMLEKNLKGLSEELYRLPELKYTKAPRHIEEAVLFIKSNNFLTHPELNKLKISIETESGFSEYISLLMKHPSDISLVKSAIPANLRNTYWYYLDFK